jgi:hypothetical protein
MHQATARHFIIINGKKIIAGFFFELYLQAVIDPEFETHILVNVPGKLVIFYRSNNAKQPRAFEKFFGKGFIVYF